MRSTALFVSVADPLLICVDPLLICVDPEPRFGSDK